MLIRLKIVVAFMNDLWRKKMNINEVEKIKTSILWDIWLIRSVLFLSIAFFIIGSTIIIFSDHANSNDNTSYMEISNSTQNGVQEKNSDSSVFSIKSYEGQFNSPISWQKLIQVFVGLSFEIIGLVLLNIYKIMQKKSGDLYNRFIKVSMLSDINNNILQVNIPNSETLNAQTTNQSIIKSSEFKEVVSALADFFNNYNKKSGPNQTPNSNTSSEPDNSAKLIKDMIDKIIKLNDKQQEKINEYPLQTKLDIEKIEKQMQLIKNLDDNIGNVF